MGMMPLALMSPDAQNEISKAIVEYESCKFFVNRYFQYTVNAFPQVPSMLQGVFLQLDQVNLESQRLLYAMQMYPFSYITEKLYLYKKQYGDVLSFYEGSLLNILPEPSYDISLPTQSLYIQIRNSLLDLKISLEYQYHLRNRVIVTRGNVKECSDASMALDRSYSLVLFMHFQLVNRIYPVLANCVSWKLTLLCSIKIKLLESLVENVRLEFSNLKLVIERASNLQFEISELDSSSTTSDSQDPLSVTQDSLLSLAANAQASPDRSLTSTRSNGQEVPVDRNQARLRQTAISDQLLTSSPKGRTYAQALISPTASTISDIAHDNFDRRGPYNRGEDLARKQQHDLNDDLGDLSAVNDSCIEQSMMSTISSLLCLTDEETTRVLDDEVDDITNLIQQLRRTDVDIDEWFVDRGSDPFVKEYIASFERHLASRLPSPDCENTLPDSQCQPWIRKYQMKSSYKPYIDINCLKSPFGMPYSEGVLYFERRASTDGVLGVVILGSEKIFFPGIDAINRSLTGDRVRFEVLDNCGAHRKGRVVCTLERGGWSVLCKVSLTDRNLMIPYDDKGPPVIVFNAPGVNVDADRSTVGSAVRKFIVKIIGWPLQMTYPVGIIEMDAQGNIEE